MNYLTISDLALIVLDIISNKWEILMRFAMGPIYGEALKGYQDALAEIVKALSRRPLSEELAETDGDHDDYGRAIYYLDMALRNLALLSPMSRETIAELRDALVPTLAMLQKSYQDEAYAAQQNRPKIAAMEERLKAFGLGDITLFDLAQGFVEKGINLEALLRERAGKASKTKDPEAVRASQLRGELLSLLSRLRANIKDEISLSPALPAKLEGDLFGYMDQLAESREEQAAAASVSEDDAPEPAEEEDDASVTG